MMKIQKEDHYRLKKEKKLLKVVIADDEEKVCKLIKHLIEWESMGMELAAIVNDGKKAFEAIVEHQPDIVITDIRMPTYDGIELIRKTKELYPNVYFIIISGYSQFEYAQQAIKYGVENYLLKPLKKRELQETLNKIIEKKNSINMGLSEREELREKLHSSEEKNNRKFISEILSSSNPMLLQKSLEEINLEYSCHFKEGNYAVIDCRPFVKNTQMDSESYALLLSKIQTILEQKLACECKEMISAIYDNEIICLLNVGDTSLKSIKKRLNMLRIDIGNLKAIFEEFNMVIGLSNISDSISYFLQGMFEAKTAMLNRVLFPRQYMIEYAECKKATMKLEDIFNVSDRKDIISFIELMDINGVLGDINRIVTMIDSEKDNLDGELIFKIYDELIATLLFAAKNHMINYVLPAQAFFEDKYKMFLTYQEVFGWLSIHVKEQMEKYLESKKELNSIPIRQAKQYIHDNFNRTISLESVSNVVGFNPAYFSSLFKKETGKNFTEYLLEVRVLNAKQYLTQTNMEIADISAEIGYSDVKYFSKIFKKLTGVNPSEYRKLYG